MANSVERNDRLIQQAEDNNQPLPSLTQGIDWNGHLHLTGEDWLLKGQYHHTTRPAMRKWMIVERDGQVKTVLTREEWYLNGQLHASDNPALRLWGIVDGEAVLMREEWWLNGKRHRIGAPAFRMWSNDNGLIYLACEDWWVNGDRHRTDGASYKYWLSHRRWISPHESWYLNNVKIHPRILRQPVRVIERWWKFHQQRRQKAIENLLWDSGMTVFPGFMGLLKEY